MGGTAGRGAADPVLQHNLARLYGVATVPSDSSLRRRLDRVSPPALQRVFGRVFEVARRHKALAGFQAVGRALSAGCRRQPGSLPRSGCVTIPVA